MGIAYLRVEPTYLLAAFGTFTWFFIFYKRKKKPLSTYPTSVYTLIKVKSHWEPKEDSDTMSVQAQNKKDMKMAATGSEEVMDKIFEALF